MEINMKSIHYITSPIVGNLVVLGLIVIASVFGIGLATLFANGDEMVAGEPSTLTMGMHMALTSNMSITDFISTYNNKIIAMVTSTIVCVFVYGFGFCLAVDWLREEILSDESVNKDKLLNIYMINTIIPILYAVPILVGIATLYPISNSIMSIFTNWGWLYILPMLMGYIIGYQPLISKLYKSSMEDGVNEELKKDINDE